MSGRRVAPKVSRARRRSAPGARTGTGLDPQTRWGGPQISTTSAVLPVADRLSIDPMTTSLFAPAAPLSVTPVSVNHLSGLDGMDFNAVAPVRPVGERRARRMAERPAPRASAGSSATAGVVATRAVVVVGLVASGYAEVAKGHGPEAVASERSVRQVAQMQFTREPLESADQAEVLAMGAEGTREQRARRQAKVEAEAAERKRQLEMERATREANRNPRDVARLMLADYGWSSSQFECLDSLWHKESGWNYRAENASSHAYGIPQSLPGSKMASAGPDWRTNAKTQIEWGLGYIKDRYGSPCEAWSHSKSYNWY